MTSAKPERVAEGAARRSSVDSRSSADPDDISAQIDLIGVLGPMIGGKPSAAPNGGYWVVKCPSRRVIPASLPAGDSQPGASTAAPRTYLELDSFWFVIRSETACPQRALNGADVSASRLPTQDHRA